MGSQVIARCSCGLEKSILIGGGRTSFMTTCLFPCLCEGCHRIVRVNLLDKPMSCPECHAPDPIPYDDPRLSESPGSHHVVKLNKKDQLGRELVLTNGKYRCPKCEKMSLVFRDSLLRWD